MRLCPKAAKASERPRDVRHHARPGGQHGDRRDQGFERKLNLVGVVIARRPRATSSTCRSVSRIRWCHQMPEGVKVETPTQTEIVIKGSDKQRSARSLPRCVPPRSRSPGQGGVRYSDEVVCSRKPRRKVRGSSMNKKETRLRRARKTRAKIAELKAVRLTVFRSNCHIYAQIISGCGSRVRGGFHRWSRTCVPRSPTAATRCSRSGRQIDCRARQAKPASSRCPSTARVPVSRPREGAGEAAAKAVSSSKRGIGWPSSKPTCASLRRAR